MPKLGNYTQAVSPGKVKPHTRQKGYKVSTTFKAAKSRIGTKGVARKAKGY